jgi:Zn-dependent peptidase ImmA (M78 family)
MNPGSEGSAAAERIFSDFCTDKIPVDPARVAHALGIEVIDAYLDPDVAGAIRRDNTGRTRIYLNAEDHPNRKRFTCAHEIGHFVKHRQEDDDFEYVDYRAGAASMGVDEDERYANAFAAVLLMPETHVRRLRGLGYNDQQMAQAFGVSKAAMVNRLKNLGLYR